jgi:uncharacterized phage protein (TIGR02220 family)
LLTGGYIKLFRSLVNWEWYEDINVKTLFIHLLLTVNYEPKQWQGISIEKGQRITSVDNLAKETKLSTMQIRGCLAKLERTGEISIKTTNKFTLITVENYTKFQGEEIENNKRITNEQQTNNKRITTMEESNKKDKESNKNNIYSPVIDYLNSKCSTSYKATSSKTKTCIDARVNEGFTLEDFQKVIDIKSAEWLNTDMQKYLRPETLFGNKFESYLNQKVVVKQDKPTAKPNKFHNIIEHDRKTESEMEELAQRRMQQKLKEIQERKNI